MAGDCEICARMEGREGDPLFIQSLPQNHLYLSPNQRYPGYAILYLREHQERLDLLPYSRQMEIFGEVSRVGKVIGELFVPRRLNYECLGNVVPHIHWHIIPRGLEGDPDPTTAIWLHPSTGEVTKDDKIEISKEQIRRGLSLELGSKKIKI